MEVCIIPNQRALNTANSFYDDRSLDPLALFTLLPLMYLLVRFQGQT